MPMIPLAERERRRRANAQSQAQRQRNRYAAQAANGGVPVPGDSSAPSNPWKPTYTVTPPEPNYDALVKGSAEYQAAFANAGTLGGIDLKNTAGQLKNALIAFGDKAALQQAINNGLDLSAYGIDVNEVLSGIDRAGASTEAAQLGKQNVGNLRDIKNQLAARGMLMSGDQQFANSEEAARFKLAQESARSRLLGNVADMAGGYAQRTGERNAGVNQVYGQVASDYSQDPRYQPEKAFEVKHVAGLGNLYMSPSGQFYDDKGARLDPATEAKALKQTLRDMRDRGIDYKKTMAYRRFVLFAGRERPVF